MIWLILGKLNPLMFIVDVRSISFDSKVLNKLQTHIFHVMGLQSPPVSIVTL